MMMSGVPVQVPQGQIQAPPPSLAPLPLLPQLVPPPLTGTATASAPAAPTASQPLFACSRCFSRHPFEELSTGQQLCKDCRGAYPTVKCTYCRSEFQQTSKSSTSTICKRCEQNVKIYGKPTACEYCNIIAAFIGNKCQRCTSSERKYGPAVTCEQCKQRCAFNRPDDDRQIDGKLLCWYCSTCLKRLARTKQLESERRSHMRSRLKNHHRRPSRSDLSKGGLNHDLSSENHPLEKKAKLHPMHGELDPNSSDHVVAMTHLKETIAGLEKKLSQKEAQLLAKDKQITELKAQHFTLETEMRNQMKGSEKIYQVKFDQMQAKIQQLLKEVATLSKTANKNKLKKTVTAAASNTENSGGSGTDSPSAN